MIQYTQSFSYNRKVIAMDLFKASEVDVEVEDALQQYIRTDNLHGAQKLLRDKLLPFIASGHTELVPRIREAGLFLSYFGNLRSDERLDDTVDRLSVWLLGALTESARMTRYARVALDSAGKRGKCIPPIVLSIGAIARHALYEQDAGLACVAQYLIAFANEQPGWTNIYSRVGGSVVIRELDEIVDAYVQRVRFDLSM